MNDIIIKAVQLIASLSILVILHELGHFIPAKLFKTRVEKFYLYFNPWFSLFKVKRGETEYGIGWLPLGGYVKISGMIDESMDKEQMKQPPQPYEFRSKPAWQRLIIMIGGVTVNVILAMFIYSMTLFVWGEKYLPTQNLTDGIWTVDSLANDVGLQNGDKILSINGQEVAKFSDIMSEMLSGGTMEIERQGKSQFIEIPTDFVSTLIDNEAKQLIYPRMPAVVAQVDEESANADKLMAKDKIVGINGVSIKYFDELKTQLQDYSEENVSIVIDREGKLITQDVFISEGHTIGFAPAFFSFTDLERGGVYEFANLKYNAYASIPAGINKAMDKLNFYVKQFKLILNPETGAYKGLGGFASIGNLFPAAWSWQAFWEITAFLSIILAFMNILPIPALDGGHVMFLLYEMVSGRKPSEKFLEYAQLAGFVILITLLLYANGMDVIRSFK